MLKIISLWFLIVNSSPFVVLIGADLFQVTGWLAIGTYDFNIYDGLYRSLIYFIITTPVVIALYLGRPKFHKVEGVKLKINFNINSAHISLMVIFCIVAFYFDLGITGVETVAPFRLSGLVHYIRSYFFLFLIAVYIFNKNKPSLILIVLYSVVAGITGGSRFAAVAPLVLFLLRNFINYNGKMLKIDNALIAFCIFLSFVSVTAFRNVLFAENYSFNNIPSIIGAMDFGEIDYIFQGFSQLFLRLGIGRDVILSFEVANFGVCSNLWGLFFESGSCNDPPLDFYGMRLDNNRFYIAPPALSSLFVISGNFSLQLIVSIAYSAVVYLMCLIVGSLNGVPYGNFLAQAAFFLIIIFVMIGPIKFAWILISFIILSVIFFTLARSSLRAR